MSEYQYFEFQALDRPLTQAEMKKLRSVSSRAHITPTSFVNEYSWGDFKGDPVKWMKNYFDAFLYISNWGSRRFMLRIPKRLLDSKTVSQYRAGDGISCRAKDQHLILSFDAEIEDRDWVDGEGWLASLVSLRSDVMRGDHRCLYLGWLMALQGGELKARDVEPAVPPGLGDLNAALQSLVDFLDLDPDLLAAAAEGSGARESLDLSQKEIDAWAAKLSAKEKDRVVAALVGGESRTIGEELRRRAFREIRGEQRDREGVKRRSVLQLSERAKSIAVERKQREAEARAKAKAKRDRKEV